MLNVIVIGLGPIGLSAAKAVRADPGMSLAGLVDLDPAKVGKTLSELEGGSWDRGPRVAAALAEAVRPRAADVAIITTASHLERIAPTLRQCIQRRLHVVSSCEEMSFPRLFHAALSDELDRSARRAKVALLGTGVNPGFVMDLLPLVLSSMAVQVTAIRVIRRLDAATRRRPLQAKVGATMTPRQFNQLKRQGNIGHMGIGQSVALIAAGLGRQARARDISITLNPVIADRPLDSLLGKIQPGQVCGMRNTARWSGRDLAIELDLTMAVGAADPEDRIELAGPTPLRLVIPGSTPGDSATVAALINGAKAIAAASPGLRTVLDMPPMACRKL